MKLFSIVWLALVAFSTAHAAKVVELSSDKSVYAVGENAVLRANFSTRPDINFEFDIVGTINGEPLPADRVTDFQMFSHVKNLQAGTYTWDVQVVLQDARYARDLKESITYYTNLAVDLDAKIAIETDPLKLENLIKRRDEALLLKAAAITELSNIRSPVFAPTTLTFNVQ